MSGTALHGTAAWHGTAREITTTATAGKRNLVKARRHSMALRKFLQPPPLSPPVPCIRTRVFGSCRAVAAAKFGHSSIPVLNIQ